MSQHATAKLTKVRRSAHGCVPVFRLFATNRNLGRTFMAILSSGFMLLRAELAYGLEVERAAAAEALFNEGIGLLEAGDAEHASAKFRASQELDPGVGTLMYLAECYRRMGRTASAWTQFLEAAALARTTQQPERAVLAQAHADELASSLSRLTVQISPHAVAAGLQIHRGGLLLKPEAWGSALPVDPGSHVIVATAPGCQPYRRTVHVRGNGDQVVVEVPALLPRRVEPVPMQGLAANQPLSAERGDAVDRRILHPITWGLGGLTLAGAALGTAFAVWAERIEANALKDCEPGPKCPPSGLSELDRAQRHANVAYAAFATAGIALVAATSWEIYSRRSNRSSQAGNIRWWLATNSSDSRLGTLNAQLILQGRFE